MRIRALARLPNTYMESLYLGFGDIEHMSRARFNQRIQELLADNPEGIVVSINTHPHYYPKYQSGPILIKSGSVDLNAIYDLHVLIG